jgi:hypothetical protein
VPPAALEALRAHSGSSIASFGEDGEPRVWQAPTCPTHPTVVRRVVAKALAENEAVGPGRLELPPTRRLDYVGFLDLSGGAQDAFTLAVAQLEKREGVEVVVPDHVSDRRPPFSPEAIVAEFATVLKRWPPWHRVRAERPAEVGIAPGAPAAPHQRAGRAARCPPPRAAAPGA